MPAFRSSGRPIAGPLLLYLLMACAMMSPFVSVRLVQSTAGDLEAHLSGIIEAKSALREGQFPIRVAPTQNDKLRYPIFQFYGNFPYTLSAVLSLSLRCNPYLAWKLVHLIGLTLAGFFTYRSALTLTGRKIPSVIAGAAFIFTPYMWTDIHARFAYAETISFLLLPQVTYFSLRSFVKARWVPVVLAGVSWNLLALSHNITYVYASAFLGLFFLSMLRPSRRGLLQLLRVGLGYALGAVLTLWYIVPQLKVLRFLNVGESAGTPFVSNVFTPFRLLTSPWLSVSAEAAKTTARLGVQVGWPILLAAIVTVAAMFFSRWLRRRRRMAGRIVICFAVAFYMVWSPQWSILTNDPGGNFWELLPQVFWYVQFTYRILAIVVLFGSLLIAYALAALFPRGMRAKSLLLCLFLIGLAGSTYYPRHPKLPRAHLARLAKEPEMGNGGAGLLYLLSPKAIARQSMFHPDANIAAEGFGVLGQGWLRAPGRLILTPPRDSNALLLEGNLPKEFGGPVTLTAAFGDVKFGTSKISPGRFKLRLPFDPNPPEQEGVVILSLVTDRWIKPRAVYPAALGEEDISLHLDSLTFETAANRYPPLIGYEQLGKRVSVRSISTCILTTNQPSVVQLPILCYPGLMSVTDNGAPAAYRNLGRLVAVELPPGPHLLVVSFTGVSWANISSAIGWVIVFVLLGFAGSRSLLRGKAERKPQQVSTDRRSRSDFPPRAALGGFVCLTLGLAVASVGGLFKQLNQPARLKVTASSFESEYSKPEFAFDDDPTTAWAALGSNPASMIVRFSRAGKLNGLVLESRQTALIEAWQKVRVGLYLADQKLHEQSFELPQQRTTPVIQLDLPTTKIDRMELNFSDPVLTTRDGSQTFNSSQVNPGYQEIRVLWAK